MLRFDFAQIFCFGVTSKLQFFSDCSDISVIHILHLVLRYKNLLSAIFWKDDKLVPGST